MNSKKSPWVPLVIILISIAAFFITSGDEEPGVIFATVALVVVILLAVLVSQKAKAKKAQRDQSPDHRPEDPRMKSFTKPDAPCVVCEHTGEDHLQRDKNNRIRQLDDWLKSGLIDRKEYVVLKDRYERDL